MKSGPKHLTHKRLHELSASERQAIRTFVEAVEREAENNMLKTGKLEGAHYAAMKRLLNELDSNPSVK